MKHNTEVIVTNLCEGPALHCEPAPEDLVAAGRDRVGAVDHALGCSCYVVLGIADGKHQDWGILEPWQILKPSS